jgi:hypothetical protein
MSDAAPGILFGRLPPGWARREPPIVTTLRRYVRRRASQHLLDRLAGGPRHFRDLDATWVLRGPVRGTSTPRAGGELGVRLGLAERQIALQQLIAECEAARAGMPGVGRLARLFGTNPATIENDLAVMIEAGRISKRRFPA